MAQSRLSGVAIRGVVSAVPGPPLAIEDLDTRASAEDVARAKAKVGLDHLHRVGATGLTANDLCIAAAEALLHDLGWRADSVDALLCVTQQPDHFLPANACLAQHRLGLSPAVAAFDLALGCSGYVYGLMLAAHLLAHGGFGRILLLAGDTVSRLCSPGDQGTALLFGDAGSATALESAPGHPAWSFVAGTDGAGAESLIVPGGGFRHWSANPQPAPTAAQSFGPHLQMDGLAVFAFALQRVPPLLTQVLALQGWQPADCHHFVFHQANAMMLKVLAQKMRLPNEKVPINIGTYGNTSSASIPLVLADDLAHSLRANSLRLALLGFGVGFSWAAMAGEVGPLACARVVHVRGPAC